MSEPIKTRLDDDTADGESPSSAPNIAELADCVNSQPPRTPSRDIPAEERTMGMFCHLAALSGYVVTPVFWLLGPLIVWLMKKETMPFVDQEGKKAINFQISVMIYATICLPLCMIFIGIPLLFALGIFDLVMTIVNAMKAGKGEETRYPLSMNFIK